MASTLNMLLVEYAESHQNQTNKLIHWICVPLIMFSLIGLLVSMPFFITKLWYINWASFLLVFTLLYYFRLSLSLGLAFLPISIILLGANWLLFKYFGYNSIQMALFSIILFFLAWVGQFFGHKIEGKKPSFLKDVQFLLIGPAWLLSAIIKLDSK